MKLVLAWRGGRQLSLPKTISRCRLGAGALLYFVGLLALAFAGCDWHVERGESDESAPKEPPVADAPATSPKDPTPPSDADSRPSDPGASAPGGRGGVIAPVAPTAPPSGAPRSFAQLVQRTDSAVVFVRTVQAQQRGFRRYLGEGSGSGFVFDPSGKILTNYHVVGRAHAIQVEFADGSARPAKVVGADPSTDVAVLAVGADEPLPALPLGDSDDIQVGDWVVAIGNPFGLEHTVSAGIISAKERTSQDVDLGSADGYYSFLQTDASINPGNSGGPLLDLSGRVVGMNTAINPRANSIGFAIPVNMIKELLPRLLKDGVVHRAALGVAVADVRQADRDSLGLPDRNGALIVRVQPGGPAALAGFRPLDVIVEFDGQTIRSPEDLRWRASLAKVGEPVEVVVVRDAERVVLSPTPGSQR